MASVKVGDMIYYTGDMANPDGWGNVERVTLENVVLRLQDGRVLNVLPQAIGDIYRGHYDPRFVTLAAYAHYKEGRQVPS